MNSHIIMFLYVNGFYARFTPFYFENGNSPQNKNVIVLSSVEDDLLVASLPTSKDYLS
jgi:hypothetical protein